MKKIIKKFVKLTKIKKLNFSARAIINFTVLYVSQTIWTISKNKCLSAKTISINTQKQLIKKLRKSKLAA